MSLWLFHTPDHAVAALPAGVPVVAAIKVTVPELPSRIAPVSVPALARPSVQPVGSAA
jgi:hypothetical protein